MRATCKPWLPPAGYGFFARHANKTFPHGIRAARKMLIAPILTRVFANGFHSSASRKRLLRSSCRREGKKRRAPPPPLPFITSIARHENRRILRRGRTLEKLDRIISGVKDPCRKMQRELEFYSAQIRGRLFCFLKIEIVEGASSDRRVFKHPEQLSSTNNH